MIKFDESGLENGSGNRMKFLLLWPFKGWDMSEYLCGLILPTWSLHFVSGEVTIVPYFIDLNCCGFL